MKIYVHVCTCYNLNRNSLKARVYQGKIYFKGQLKEMKYWERGLERVKDVCRNIFMSP
jgi:hypothetical protein